MDTIKNANGNEIEKSTIIMDVEKMTAKEFNRLNSFFELPKETDPAITIQFLTMFKSNLDLSDKVKKAEKRATEKLLKSKKLGTLLASTNYSDFITIAEKIGIKLNNENRQLFFETLVQIKDLITVVNSNQFFKRTALSTKKAVDLQLFEKSEILINDNIDLLLNRWYDMVINLFEKMTDLQYTFKAESKSKNKLQLIIAEQPETEQPETEQPEK